MPTENTSLKNITPAEDCNTTNEMVVGKINTYQRTFLIVAGSLLALLVMIAVAGTSGGQHLQSSAHEIAEGVVALAEYQVDSTNLALTKDIFNGFKISGEGSSDSNGKKTSRVLKQKKKKKSKTSKNKKKKQKPTTDNSDLSFVSENGEGCPCCCWGCDREFCTGGMCSGCGSF